ncbi:hypothetical protein ACIBEH_04910 [Nocardia salmonicida]|uniref:hypothetical protein n=1 Tax=Nocardia salmonicida TaxID=53431 RepID=UPI003789DA47
MNDVELLAYPQRMHALAQYARTHAGHPGFAVFLTEMAEHGDYGRRIALHLAMAARDLTYIAKVLAGHDLGLRRAALRAVRTLPVPDSAVGPVLDDASTALRIALYRTIVHARRTELADSLLPEVDRRWGAREAAMLLPACSPTVVDRWLPTIAHGVTAWKTLTRRHPRAVLRCLHNEFATTRKHALWPQRTAAIGAAADSHPVLVLVLLERHGLRHRAESLPGETLGKLFRADPRRTAHLLSGGRQSRFAPSPSVLRHCSDLTDDELLNIVSTHDPQPVLRALPVERRGRIYLRLRLHELTRSIVLPLLPRELAASEARRLREWQSSVQRSSREHLDSPAATLPVTAFLPLDEAEPALRAAAFGGDPRHRELARTLLLGAVQRGGDRTATVAVLGEIVDRTRNDRDPARAAVLEGLCALRLDPLWADELDRLVDAAIHARDASERTRTAARNLADRALNTERALADWGLRVHARLIDRFGTAVLVGQEPPTPVVAARRRARRRMSTSAAPRLALGRTLRRGQERELLALLTRPRDHALNVALARSLGARLGDIPELRQDLRRAVLHGPDEVAGVAAALMLRHVEDREGEVASLLVEDPHTIRFAAVWRTVATRRTDLLPTTPGAHEVEPGMVGRWTDRQRATVGSALVSVADDRDAGVEDRIRALRGLGRMSHRLSTLFQHAGGDEPVIAEAAIEACGTHPRVLHRLLRISGSVALATASTVCRVSEPGRVLDALETALFERRVGPAKLAARQLVTQRVPGAVDLLLRAWAEPDLHPDVRIAVATALRRMPEDPRTRQALAEVPHRYATVPMVRALLQATPEEYAAEHRPPVADLVRALLATATDPGVRFRAAKAFAIWVPWYSAGTGEILDAAVTGDATDLTIFAALCGAGVIREESLAVLRRLIDADDPGRVLEVAKILDCHGRGEPWQLDIAERAAELLFGRPLHVVQAARMVLGRVPLSDADPQNLAATLHTVADRLTPLDAARLVSTAHIFANWSSVGQVALPAIELLIARGDVTGGVLAVALLDRGRNTPERQRALDRLRSSPHPDLSRLAWDVGP